MCHNPYHTVLTDVINFGTSTGPGILYLKYRDNLDGHQELSSALGTWITPEFFGVTY